MKTWIAKLRAVWGRGLLVQLPALLLAAGGAFWLAYANPSGAFSMLAMLGAACLVFLTQLPRAAKYGWCAPVSYTHLDVYKRQRWPIRSVGGSACRTGSPARC